ncbi:MAG: 16S rRNA (cytidine(1402)-2'-O)-methyltransferase [Selenomonadaceae bacterium]|nr:16S rRNA (cytidine(1402)-2'-O)-methyltransferase [Selenomonadaceae bacterium]MBR6887180.1 16S rRNA (cytidine(1402)-2'-O)-methyltransferase [Selenomonadaceae bacterium]
MTFRAIRILREVDLIAAEDTRRTRKLLTHFEIHTPLIRFDENCKAAVAEKILQRLQAGESVAVVSDAGLPAISDPGADLVRLAIDAGINVCPVPGANAALSALICSGLDTRKFLFAGFAPKTKKNRREFLEKLSTIDATIIFYEAPHRLKNFLAELAEIFGEREIVLARELTKVHEEFLRGKLSELKNIAEPRGEFVVVVEGKNFVAPLEENPLEFYRKLLAQGLDKKSAMREAAKKFNVSRREIYNAIIKEGIQ